MTPSFSIAPHSSSFATACGLWSFRRSILCYRLMSIVLWLLFVNNSLAQCKIQFGGDVQMDSAGNPYIVISDCKRPKFTATQYSLDCNNQCNGTGVLTLAGWSPGGTLGFMIITQAASGCLVIGTIGPMDDYVHLQAGALRITASCGGCSTFRDINVYEESCNADGTCGLLANYSYFYTNTQEPFSSSRNANTSINSVFNLGHATYGVRAGAFTIYETNPACALSTPLCLKYNYPTNSECQLITNSAGIRQLKMPEGLVNVTTNSAVKYYIDYYLSPSVGAISNGLYTFSGSPTYTVTVENPDATGNSSNNLRFTHSDGYVFDYAWQTNGWALTNAAGMSKKCRTETWTNANSLLIVCDNVLNSADAAVSTKTRTFTNASFGLMVFQDVTGTGTTSLTNSYSYWSNGWLKQVIYADGNWTYWEYDSLYRPTNMLTAFGMQGPTTSAALCRQVTYDYTTNSIGGSGDDGNSMVSVPRLKIESLLGHEISRTYAVALPGQTNLIQCVNPGAAWNAASNLVTISRTVTNGGLFYGRLQSVLRPDGTMDIYQYTTNSSAYVTNAVLSGQPNGGQTDIVDGIKTVTVKGNLGQMVSRTVMDIASGITIDQQLYSDYDAYNRPRKITYLDGTFTWTEYNCCGPTTVTNREGTVINYYQDALQRQSAVVQNSITTTNVLDSAGHILKRIRIGNDASQITQATNAYDTAGRLLKTSDALGNSTTYSETNINNQLIRTTTNSDGSTRIQTYLRDSQLATLTGTAVRPIRYTNGVLQDGSIWRAYAAQIKLDGNGNDTSESVTNLVDMLARNYKTIYSDGAVQQSYFNTNGQLVKAVDPDGVTTLYQYNSKGEQEYSATDMDRNGTIDFSGTDRIRRGSSNVGQASSLATVNARKIQGFAWATNNSSFSNLVSALETSTDGLITWSSSYGLTNKGQTFYSGGGNRYVTNTAPDGSYTISYSQNGQLQSVTRKDSFNSQLSSVTYSYDSHGRQRAVTDARSGTTVYAYDNADRVTSVTTPPPGTGQNTQTTTFTYDAGGRITRTGLPDGGGVTNIFSLKGELRSNFGTRTYPVSYAYDYQGRMKYMTNWSSFSSGGGARVTTWTYDPQRGFLTNNVYDGNSGPIGYAYTAGGRLKTRIWARNITTTYATNSAGDVASITYSDGSTPTVNFTYDRLGQATNIVQQGTSTNTLVFSGSGQVLSETFNGLSVTNAYDWLLRRTVVALSAQPSTLTAFGYDAASRLNAVTNGVNTANYIYLANSPLVGQIGFAQSGNNRMTTTKSYDNLNRLQSISSAASNTVSSAHTYNDANQRTRIAQPDGSYWVYQYDSLGQVTSGKKYWSDGTPVPGQQFEYAFDDIGNRTSTKAGGDQNGTSLRLASYTANSLNQYPSRDVPGTNDIIGIANATGTATVNGQSTYRKGEYYQKALSVPNTTTNAYQSVTNQAILATTTNTIIGNVFVPKTSEVFGFDSDGNQTSDGRWYFIWDGENRLTTMVSSNVVDAGKRKLDLAYDSRGRRVRKTVSIWSGGAWQVSADVRFAYDGRNLLAELNATNNAVIRSFIWGLDLSGTVAGAGGVGGCLGINSTGNGVHFAAYDGRGNVSGLINATNGNTSGEFEYGPLGETIRASGPMAADNPFRFSTKYTDNESDLVYYGFRYFNATTGRWLTRDPIEEPGFTLVHGCRTTQRKVTANPYIFVENNPITYIDPDGLEHVFVKVEVEIRPPDVEPGTKCWHYVEIDEFGTKLSEQSFIGITELPIPVQGRGTLSATVSGTHPNFTVSFTGSTVSVYVLPAAVASSVYFGVGPVVVASMLRIDYGIAINLDFCMRTGTVTGSHDGYPSYMAFVNGNKVYDFPQTTHMFLGVNLGILALLPPMDVTPTASFTW